MSAKALIHGEKSVKYIDTPEYKREMVAQPGVVLGDYQMEVVVWLFEQDSPSVRVGGFSWGLVTPRNFIAYWRAMLILEKVERIGSFDLAYAYYAGQRDPSSSDKEQAKGLIEQIGVDAYQEIMSRVIPDDVRDIIIDLVSQNSTSSWPITEEIAAGTLDWCEDFLTHGVRHPERKTYGKDILEGYKSLIHAYAKDNGYKMNYPIIESVEDRILDVYEKGLDGLYDTDLLFALSVVIAHSGFSSVLGAIFGASEEQEDKRLNTEITKILDWVNEKSSSSENPSHLARIIKPFRKRKPKLLIPHAEQFSMIKGLYLSWSEYEIVNPIVPVSD